MHSEYHFLSNKLKKELKVVTFIFFSAIIKLYKIALHGSRYETSGLTYLLKSSNTIKWETRKKRREEAVGRNTEEYCELFDRLYFR